MSKKPAFTSQFEFTPDNRAVVIALIGKLDPVAVDELHPQIQEVYRAGLRRFVFDLTNLEFAGSLGLRLLVGLQNQVRGEGAVTVCNPTDEVLSMLTLTKLTQVLPNYPNRDEALAGTGG
ncbi:STAS domain-containing protein [Gemmata sp. G18]|uniref:Anti-sigma factor antagonist n=1 Tax=Gemmata palustris TaxID=2822762 RepID=A0ABS5BZB3_9BACT|nr:STAS domain-containing protein [Gemmata palustris]MBP3958983.1 STAS domain-containing protein [Gemmata palustris]